MGSYDGAETCELVGLYILSQLNELDINVGLYRDDGLAVCKKTPRQTEILKKEICKIFKTNKLKITIEANLKYVNFLDISMDLRNNIYKPYMKENNEPLYVHKDSNHPPNIIKNIPKNINKRICSISSSEATFNSAKEQYQAALQKSGYTHKLKYEPENREDQERNNKKRNRKRNITWFNPPFSKHVTTNIGKKFLKLLDRSFPPTHQLHKLLNRNTVKVSYSCMPNVKQIIENHNRKIVNTKEAINTETENCNCRTKETCPLDKQCLTSGVIYQATVLRQDKQQKETYIGLTENTFKTRYNGHTNSFKHNSKRNATTLSQYIWKLKDKKIQYNITWKIIARSKTHSTTKNTCNLCTKEKYYIIFRPEMGSLNNRNELATSCRHRKQYLLKHIK